MTDRVVRDGLRIVTLLPCENCQGKGSGTAEKSSDEIGDLLGIELPEGLA